MSLLTDIKWKREQKRKKEPFKRNAFNQISHIVSKYRLDKKFLKALDGVEEYLTNVNLNANRVLVKVSMENPLFPLVTQDEYALTRSIISKIDNPYLLFAHSPEELLLCGPLYQLSPTLSQEKLVRYHFETLFLHERAKTINRQPDAT